MKVSKKEADTKNTTESRTKEQGHSKGDESNYASPHNKARDKDPQDPEVGDKNFSQSQPSEVKAMMEVFKKDTNTKDTASCETEEGLSVKGHESNNALFCDETESDKFSQN